MINADEARLANVLAALGIGSGALLGQGGESWVYLTDNNRIARINRPGTALAQVIARTTLLSELSRSAEKVSFAIPEVFDTIIIGEFIVTIERRLPGRPLNQVLNQITGSAREPLIRAYLEAAARIGDLAIERSWYGDLMKMDAIQTKSFFTYLKQRAARSLKAAGPDFMGIDSTQLASALPEPAGAALVHLDAFPGNMLVDEGNISAVLDFGAPAIMGDRRLDPLTAAVYLDPAITPTATGRDRSIAQAWLKEKNLTDFYTPTRNWIAAYWSFATDDLNLYRWCRKTLIE